MIHEPWPGSPERVVAKIEKVLGISPSDLPEHDVVKLVDDLRNTALTFDREERDVGQLQLEEPPGDTAGIAAPGPRGRSSEPSPG